MELVNKLKHNGFWWCSYSPRIWTQALGHARHTLYCCAAHSALVTLLTFLALTVIWNSVHLPPFHYVHRYLWVFGEVWNILINTTIKDKVLQKLSWSATKTHIESHWKTRAVLWSCSPLTTPSMTEAGGWAVPLRRADSTSCLDNTIEPTLLVEVWVSHP